MLGSWWHRISIREELSPRGSNWQYILEMEHLPLQPTKPSLTEGRYPTVGHYEAKLLSSWAWGFVEYQSSNVRSIEVKFQNLSFHIFKYLEFT